MPEYADVISQDVYPGLLLMNDMAQLDIPLAGQQRAAATALQRETRRHSTCTSSLILPAGRGCWKCLRRFSWRKRSRYRRIPGNWAQFKLLFRRAGVKWVRGWGYKFIDLLLFVTAALVIGVPPTGRWA